MRELLIVPALVLALGLAAQASAVAVAFDFEAQIYPGAGYGDLFSSFPELQSTRIVNDPGSFAGGLNYGYFRDSGTSDGAGNYSDLNGGGNLYVDGYPGFNFKFKASRDAQGNLVGTIQSFQYGFDPFTDLPGSSGSISHLVVTSTTVSGRFEANIVPEPVSLLTLGLPALALVRRRKRA